MKIAAALWLAVSVACAGAPKAAHAPHEIIDVLPFHPPPGQPREIARLNLSKPFHLRPDATFTATQGPPEKDPYFDGETVSGEIRLCVQIRKSAPCAPELGDRLSVGRSADMFSRVHSLEASEIVYPRGIAGAPLLHLQVASLHAFDGDQVRSADVLSYRAREHRFEIVFHEQFGRNNNQEARYMHSGPLRGAIIVVHPTQDAPYGYWITVNELTPDNHYREALHYRSATRYDDGNRLAVIDSEMPNILRRLGLWRPGQPLPLPNSGCAKPRLVKSELWCS